MEHKLLFISDDKQNIMESVLRKYNTIYECVHVNKISEVEEVLSKNPDYFAMIAFHEGDEIIDLFEKIRDSVPAMSRILITSQGHFETVIRAINRGKVSGFFQHPVDMISLDQVLNFALLEYEKFRKIRKDSLFDSLTSLYNRRFINRELNRILEMSKRHENTFAIIFGDVNNFKNVNDTYGHILGDILLQNIGKVFIQTCRGSDIISRYGGDEFLILIEKATSIQAKRLIQRLHKAMGLLRIPEMETEEFSLSLGQANFPVDGSTINEMIKSADRRMYIAKRKSRKRV